MSQVPPRINYIELPSEKMEETKSFYTAVFGWEWNDFGPTYASTTGEWIEVGLNAEAEPSASHAPDDEQSIGPLILFATDDLEAIQSAVCAAGGAILSSIYRYPGGRRFHFQDPSWNVLGVYQSDAAQ